MKDIPNLLTIFRILSIPIIVAVLYSDLKYADFIATALFLSASLTDFFDGYLARVLSAQSSFGKLFDPIADKLIVVAMIMMLIYRQKINDINVIAAIVIVTREVLVSGLREFASNINMTIEVSNLGKVKTFMQLSAIAALTVVDIGNYFYIFGTSTLWLASILGIISSYEYLKKLLNAIKRE